MREEQIIIDAPRTKDTIETENIVFNYFRYIKTAKYFGVKSNSYINEKHYSITDISQTLANMKLDQKQQIVLIRYGNLLHAPRYTNSRAYAIWRSAIEQIHAEFIKKGIIKCY